jgi:hypothetical protein
MIKYFNLLVLVCIHFGLVAQEKLHVSGKVQLNGWTTVNFTEPIKVQLGSRFVPEINLEKKIHDITMEAQISFHGSGSLNYQNWEKTGSFEKYSPYRMWASAGGSRFELRLGLQKINFGSAMMLRPLMWFDRIDPRDPLQLTDGVFALLGRYYFKNNANIWLWSLLGNDETRGWETIASEKKIPEKGGRFQFPLYKGECAISFHNRKADLAGFHKDTAVLARDIFTQNRYAIDGKWDFGVGAWFEYVLEENRITGSSRPLKYQQTLNVGMDYTFLLGNGVNTATEFFYLVQSDEPMRSDIHAEISALSLSYPIGLVDRISTIIYYSWEDNHWYRFINMERKYDFWSFYCLVYWNPRQFGLYTVDPNQNLYTGKGFQLMAVYNF